MATLSKDGTGSWHARGVMVRDARHTHNGPQEPKLRSSKDTRTFCRGKRGVPHQLVVTLDTSSIYLPKLVRHCSRCGRQFGYHYTKSWSTSPPPDWTTPELLAELRAAEAAPRPAILHR
jgi:hypothetical protein